VAICEEYNPKEKTLKTSDLKLTSPKSGFGICSRNE